MIYSNKVEDDDEYLSQVENTTLDSIFSFFDFMIQLNMFVIFFMRIATKEGFISTLAPGSSLFVSLRNFGLAQNVNQITIFCLVHLN